MLQGSTLGLILFVIYIKKLNFNSRLFLFADDTAVAIVGKPWVLIETNTHNRNESYNKNELMAMPQEVDENYHPL